ncbi:hypothetical protein PG987_009337 [Apiospora arundinis]
MASISREDPFAAHTTDPNRYNAASALPPIDSNTHSLPVGRGTNCTIRSLPPLLRRQTCLPKITSNNSITTTSNTRHSTRPALPDCCPFRDRIDSGDGSPGAVRRNLFQSQLTRRPTSTSSNSAETLRMDADNVSNTSDIVIRDEHGDFEVGDPPTPPMDEPEAEALDDMQENERERQKLAEVVKHHQINHNRGPAQPEEVMEALRASMRAQVAALSEDSWMYEPEAETRNQ